MILGGGMYSFKLSYDQDSVTFVYSGPDGVEHTVTFASWILHCFLEVARKRPLAEKEVISLYLGGKGGKS